MPKGDGMSSRGGAYAYVRVQQCTCIACHISKRPHHNNVYGSSAKMHTCTLIDTLMKIGSIDEISEAVAFTDIHLRVQNCCVSLCRPYYIFVCKTVVSACADPITGPDVAHRLTESLHWSRDLSDLIKRGT